MPKFNKLPKKQQDIVNTATDLFQRHGMKRITVEEICSKATVSKMTFYKYYDNKTELVKFIFRKIFDDGWGVLDSFDEDMTFPEKLEHILDLKRQIGKKLSPEFIEEYLHATPDLAPFMGHIIQESLGRYREFIVEAQEKGEVRQDLNPDFLIAISSKMFDWIKEGDISRLLPDFSELSVQINSLLFYGILPREECEK